MIPYNWNPQQQQSGGPGQQQQQPNPGVNNNPAWQQQQQAYAAQQYAQQQQQQQALYQQYYQQQQQQAPNSFNQAMQQQQQQPQGNPFVNAQQTQFPMASNYRPPLPPGPPPANSGNAAAVNNNIPQFNQQFYGGQQQQPPLPPNNSVNMIRPPLPPSQQPQSSVQQQQLNQGQMYNNNTSSNNQQQQQLPNMNQISNILNSMKNLESIPGLDKGLEFLKNLNTNLGGLGGQQQIFPNQSQNQNQQNIMGGPNSNVAGGISIKPLMSLQVAKPDQGQQQQQPNRPLFPSTQNQPTTNKPNVPSSSTSNSIQPNPNSFLSTGSLIPNPMNPTFDKLLDKIDNNLLNNESNDEPEDPNQVLKGWKVGEGQRPASAGNQNSNNLNKNMQNRNQQQQQNIRPQQQDIVEEVFDKQTLDNFDKKFRLWEIDFEKWKSQNQNHPDRKNYMSYLGDWNKLRHQLVNQRRVIVQKIKQTGGGKPNFNPKINNNTGSKMPMSEEILKSENSSTIKIEKTPEDNQPLKEDGEQPKSTEITENAIKEKEEPLHAKAKPPPPPKLTPVQNKDDKALLEENVIENNEAEDNSTVVKEELDDEIKRLMPKIRIPKMDDGNKSPPILRKGFLDKDINQEEDDRNEFNQPPQPQKNPLQNPQQQQSGMQGQQQGQGVFNNPQNTNPFTQAFALQGGQQQQQPFNNQMNMLMNQNNPRFNRPQFPVNNNNLRQPFNPYVQNNSTNPNFRDQQPPLDKIQDGNVQENDTNYQRNIAEGEEAIPQFSRPHRSQPPTSAIAKTTTTEEESTEVFDYGHAGEEENDYDDIIHDRFQNEPNNEAEGDDDDNAPVVVDYGHGAGDDEETLSLESYRKPRLPMPPPPHLAGYYGHRRMPHPHPHFPPRGPYPYPEEYYGYDYDYEYDYEDPRYLPPPPHMMGFPRPRFPPPMGYPMGYPGPVRLPFKSRQPMADALALARGFRGQPEFTRPGMMDPIDPDYAEADVVSPGSFVDEDFGPLAPPLKDIRIAPPINDIRIAPPPPSRSERERERDVERDRSKDSKDRDRDRRKRSRSRSPKRRSHRDKSPIHLHRTTRDKDKDRDRSRERERNRGRDREHSHSSSSRDKDKDRDRDRGRDRERDRERSSRSDREKDRKKSRSKSPASDRLKIGNNPAPPPPVPISTPIPTTRSSLQTTHIEDLINLPGRKKRPTQFVIFLRGLPGSGKTHVAKLIKDKEVEHGGAKNAPRMLSIDDYFMVESEKSVKDPKSGKEYREKIMIYEYDSDAEPSYRTDLIRALKKTIETGYFNFLIVDCVNETMKDIDEMSNYAALKKFQVYIAELEGTVNECYDRNIHNRTLEDIQRLHDKWEQTPDYYIKLNIKGLFEEDVNSDVEMEDVSDIENVGDKDKNKLDNLTTEVIDLEEDEDEAKIGFDYTPSKWETIEHSEEKLNKLDGFKRKRKAADDDSTPQSMEQWLQLQMSDVYVRAPISGGKKRVRWADIAERQEQERMRDIGFVVGQTDWNRMNDPTFGASSLTKTKFI